MKKVLISCALALIPVLGWSNSLNLFNDSPFTLQATVLAADGTTLGQFTIKPQNGAQWSDEWEQEGTVNNSNISQTPYSIIWYCQNGAEYGINTNQPPGSYITPSGASGDKACPLQPQPLLNPQQNTQQ